eukprot:scaffold8804_cov115-Isochrysis_galbana.AAC.2
MAPRCCLGQKLKAHMSRTSLFSWSSSRLGRRFTHHESTEKHAVSGLELCRCGAAGEIAVSGTVGCHCHVPNGDGG